MVYNKKEGVKKKPSEYCEYPDGENQQNIYGLLKLLYGIRLQKSITF